MTSANAPRTSRIVVVDDCPDTRLLLRLRLGRAPGVEVVGEAPDGRTAVALTDRLRPDVVVMDLDMPNMDGLEAAAALRGRHPELRLIALTSHSLESKGEEAMAAGFDGFLTKSREVIGDLASILAA